MGELFRVTVFVPLPGPVLRYLNCYSVDTRHGVTSFYSEDGRFIRTTLPTLIEEEK